MHIQSPGEVRIVEGGTRPAMNPTSHSSEGELQTMTVELAMPRISIQIQVKWEPTHTRCGDRIVRIGDLDEVAMKAPSVRGGPHHCASDHRGIVARSPADNSCLALRTLSRAASILAEGHCPSANPKVHRRRTADVDS